MKKKVIKNNGFTLIEVILSMAILALVSVPLMKYFSDSLRYSVKTSIQQKATLLAQETLEELKRQPTLIQKVSGVGYGIPSMEGGYSITLPTGFDATGRGEVTMTKEVSSADIDFKVNVVIDTDNPANDIERASVHSVNDSKNVMIVEGSEEFEALNYFFTKNMNYCLIHNVTPSGSPAASPAVPAPAAVTQFLDLTDVRANLHREIVIEIGRLATAPYKYTINAKYIYACTNVTNNAIDYAPEYTILDTTIPELESVYLMFNIVNPDTDVIRIKWTAAPPATLDDAPDFILVCQNIDSLAGGGASPSPSASSPVGYTYIPFSFSQDKYSLQIGLEDNFSGWPGGEPLIRSNLIDPVDPLNNKGDITKVGGGNFASGRLISMNSTEKDVTILNIKVQVLYGTEVKAEMITTKTE